MDFPKPSITFRVRGRTRSEAVEEARTIAEGFFGGEGYLIDYQWQPGEAPIDRVEDISGATLKVSVGPFEFDVTAQLL